MDSHDNNGRAAIVGFFDGIHLGHRSLIDFVGAVAAERGLRPVAVTFTGCPLEHLRPGSEPKLLSSAADRLDGLRRLLGADGVIALEFNRDLASMTAREFMTMLRDRYGVKLLVAGFNNRFGSDRDKTFDDYVTIGRELGLEVMKAPEYKARSGVSSSAIRKAVGEGRVADAAEMLGRRYAIDGIVAAGRRVGRTIGFPTANLQPIDGRKLVPGGGVYAAWAVVDDEERYPAMVNIGTRPTVSDDGRQTIEANLIGFDGDLYGRRLRLEFVERLRGERRFDSLDDLKLRLEADRREALTALSEA